MINNSVGFDFMTNSVGLQSRDVAVSVINLLETPDHESSPALLHVARAVPCATRFKLDSDYSTTCATFVAIKLVWQQGTFSFSCVREYYCSVNPT